MRRLGSFAVSWRTVASIFIALGIALAVTGSPGNGIARAQELGSDWPQGELAEEVGWFCQACHSLQIVTQQGLTRSSWDDVLDWMVEDQGMPELDPETRARYLDFLAENFSPENQDSRVPGRR